MIGPIQGNGNGSGAYAEDPPCPVTDWTWDSSPDGTDDYSEDYRSWDLDGCEGPLRPDSVCRQGVAHALLLRFRVTARERFPRAINPT